MIRRLCMLAALAAPLGAQTNYGGSSQAFALLDRPAGARALAMGGAFEAVADDSSGLYYNPAAPAMLKRADLGLHHDAWLAGTSRENVSASAPWGAWGIGLSGAWVSYPSMELRDSRGALTGNFSPTDQAFGLSAATQYSPRLALGVTARGLREELPGSSYMGLAFGAGLIYAATPQLRLALVGQGLPQAGVGNSVSPRLSVGAANLMKDFLGGPATLAFSARMDPSAPAELSLGLEKSFNGLDALALRAGYTAYFPLYSLGSLYGLSLGAGFKLASLSFDYAWLPWGDFGSAQQLSVNWRFKADPGPATTPAPQAVQAPDPEAGALLMPPVLPESLTRSAEPAWDYRVLSDGVVKGKALEDVGRPKSAAAAYLEALKADPKDIPAWKSLGLLYDRIGKAEWAAHCREAVKKLESTGPRTP